MYVCLFGADCDFSLTNLFFFFVPWCRSFDTHCTVGTVLDLPYRFTADGDVMQRMPNFDFDNLLGVAIACCCFMELFDCLFRMMD